MCVKKYMLVSSFPRNVFYQVVLPSAGDLRSSIEPSSQNFYNFNIEKVIEKLKFVKKYESSSFRYLVVIFFC